MTAQQQTYRPGKHHWWQRLRRRRLSRWSLRLLCGMVLIALFADFIANEKPLYCKLDGEHHFPVLKEYLVALGGARWDSRFVRGKWSELPYEAVAFAPVPYTAAGLDLRNGNYRSPFGRQDVPSGRWRHWLGTDRMGRDVLAGLIAGTRVALLVGLVAMSVAVTIGLLLGALSGYFGDRGFLMSRLTLWLALPGLLLALFFFFGSTANVGLSLRLLVAVGVLSLFVGAGWMFGKRVQPSRQVAIPVDLLVMRTIEVFNSIPTLLLLLVVVAVLGNSSILWTMLVIGLVRWTGIARFLRAELLKVRTMNYMEAGRAMGFSDFRLLFRHALPNALGPVIITVAFGIASAILLESTLSFLGIGVSAQTVTWGQMLSAARQNPAAWWLAVFPGAAIFVTVTIFNLLGEALSERDG